jgi:alkaline phosphatase D
VYSDQPSYGFDPSHYALHYRQLLASPRFGSLFGRLPLYTMYDDHEIKNNWDSQEQFPFDNAMTAWQRYFGRQNPSTFTAKGANYYTFDYGSVASFFVLDTRRYRSAEALPIDDAAKTMLGARQLRDLGDWLQRATDEQYTWKFIITPDPLTIMWKDRYIID